MFTITNGNYYEDLKNIAFILTAMLFINCLQIDTQRY